MVNGINTQVLFAGLFCSSHLRDGRLVNGINTQIHLTTTTIHQVVNGINKQVQAFHLSKETCKRDL